MDYDKVRQRLEECRYNVQRYESEIDRMNAVALGISKEMRDRTNGFIRETFSFLDQHSLSHLFDVQEEAVDMGFAGGVVVTYELVDISPVKGSEHLITSAEKEFHSSMNSEYMDWMESQMAILDSLQEDGLAFLEGILDQTVMEFPFEQNFLDYALVFISTPVHEHYLSCGMDLVSGFYGPLGRSMIHRNTRPEYDPQVRASGDDIDVVVCHNPSIMMPVDDVQERVCKQLQEMYDWVHPDVSDDRKFPAGRASYSRMEMEASLVQRLQLD